MRIVTPVRRRGAPVDPRVETEQRPTSARVLRVGHRDQHGRACRRVVAGRIGDDEPLQVLVEDDLRVKRRVGCDRAQPREKRRRSRRRHGGPVLVEDSDPPVDRLDDLEWPGRHLHIRRDEPALSLIDPRKAGRSRRLRRGVSCHLYARRARRARPAFYACLGGDALGRHPGRRCGPARRLHVFGSPSCGREARQRGAGDRAMSAGAAESAGGHRRRVIVANERSVPARACRRRAHEHGNTDRDG